MKHIHETFKSLFRNIENFADFLCLCIMSMEARMSKSLSNVSQEHSFWACAVLGKMALYDRLPYLR